jgi:hypothetical protein
MDGKPQALDALQTDDDPALGETIPAHHRSIVVRLADGTSAHIGHRIRGPM